MHLIVAALTEEVAGIIRNGSYDGPRSLDGALIYTATANASTKTAVLLTGPGGPAAGSATERAIEEVNPDGVISVGFAGGTRDSLLTGNLVLATELYKLEGSPSLWDRERMGGPIIPDPTLLSLARSAVEMAGVDFQMGALVTLPTIAKTAGMKKWLGNRVGATAVDMESFAVGTAAQEAGVPFLAVRAIVDSSALDLPDLVSEVGQSPAGNRLFPVLRHLARRPDNLLQVIRLGMAAAAARASITSFIEYLSVEIGRATDTTVGGRAA